ncbi:MAG: PAS domain S-box protein [Candidatus Margulisbacteria bacterium]|nr:PAS domain S-box protein [Candidatus Margulisiibacteriota bacterium]
MTKETDEIKLKPSLKAVPYKITSSLDFRAIFDNAAMGIMILDVKRKIIQCNFSCQRLLGYEDSEMVGKNIKSLLYQRDKARDDYFFIMLAEGKRDSFKVETRFICKNGVVLDTTLTVSICRKETLKHPLIVAIIEDISKRKNAENKLRKSVHEKDILLKEIHHRVKNNLQIVTSMLNIKANSIQNQHIKKVMEDCRERVHAMSLIHETMYQSPDVSQVDFTKYIKNLVNMLFIAYNTRADEIKLSLDVEDIFLSLDSAVPCGLIINELVTNALNHAFPKGRQGIVSVSVYRKVNLIHICIQDDGIGIPPEIDPNAASSFGLYLVHVLVMQIEGELSVNVEKGTRLQLTFSDNNKEETTDVWKAGNDC